MCACEKPTLPIIFFFSFFSARPLTDSFGRDRKGFGLLFVSSLQGLRWVNG